MKKNSFLIFLILFSLPGKSSADDIGFELLYPIDAVKFYSNRYINDGIVLKKMADIEAGDRPFIRVMGKNGNYNHLFNGTHTREAYRRLGYTHIPARTYSLDQAMRLGIPSTRRGAPTLLQGVPTLKAGSSGWKDKIPPMAQIASGYGVERTGNGRPAIAVMPTGAVKNFPAPRSRINTWGGTLGKYLVVPSLIAGGLEATEHAEKMGYTGLWRTFSSSVIIGTRPLRDSVEGTTGFRMHPDGSLPTWHPEAFLAPVPQLGLWLLNKYAN